MTYCATQPEVHPVWSNCFDSRGNTSSVESVVIAWMDADYTASEAVRFVSYHLLLGAGLVAVLDNTRCLPTPVRDAALARFDAGNVLHVSRFRCLNFSTPLQLHGYYGVVQHLQASGRLQDKALVVAIDSDELVVLPPEWTFGRLRDAMLERRVCAAFLSWHMFGSSGHVCEPTGGLLPSFTRRAPTEAEVSAEARHAAIVEHQTHGLNPPYHYAYAAGKRVYPGKTVWIHGETMGGGVHDCPWCKRRNVSLGPELVSCGYANATPAVCRELDDIGALNHYAYRSQMAWSKKKARSKLVQRSGDVPSFYEQVEDRAAIEMARARIERVANIRGGQHQAQCLFSTLLATSAIA